MCFKRGSILGVAVALVLMAVPAFAAQAVTSIDVSEHSDRVDIVVRALHPLTMTPFSSSRGEYVGFEVPAKCIVASGFKQIRSGGIYSVRYGNYTSNPPKTRVVVTITDPVKYSTRKSPDNCAVTVSVWKIGHPAAQPAPSQAAAAASEKERGQVRLAKGSDSGTSAVSPPEPGDLPATTIPAAPVIKAQEKGSSLQPRPVEVARVVEPQTRPAPAISLDFIAADINDVLKALSVQSGTNIVSGADVKGEVTVSLNRVSVEDALDYVTKLSGFSYIKSGGTYLVGSARGIGNVTGEPVDSGMRTDAIPVRLADAKGLEKILEQMLPGVKVSGGDKSEGKGVAALVLAGPADMVAAAKQIVAQVESSLAGDAAGRTVRAYHIKYARPTELADTLTSLMPQVSITMGPTVGFDLRGPGAVQVAGYLGATVAAPAAGPADPPRPKVLIVSGQPADVAAAVDLLEQLDVRPPQIRIEARVTDISLNAQRNLGVIWEWSQIGFTQNVTELDVRNVPSSVESRFQRLPIDISATVNALIAEGEATLLANPSIVTLEGKPATFFVGDEIKYIIGVQQTPQGQNISTETANVGIQLRIVGDVSPDEEITLHVHPEVSVISDFIRIGTGGGSSATTDIVLPQITRRFTDHVVRVRDGETIIIGGLIRESEVNNLRKIPLLGDLPILGGLFRNRERTKSRSEIVVFITASLVRE